MVAGTPGSSRERLRRTALCCDYEPFPTPWLTNHLCVATVEPSILDRRHDGSGSGEQKNATASWTSIHPEIEVARLGGRSPNPDGAHIALGSREIVFNDQSYSPDGETRVTEGLVVGSNDRNTADVLV